MNNCLKNVSLSPQAVSIWGKTDCGENRSWLPLYMHMADSLQVADKLWDEWVPQRTKAIIEHGVGGDERLAKKLYLLLAGIHDIGKATPNFQVQTWFNRDAEQGLAWKPRQAGLLIRDELRGRSRLAHPIAGQIIFNEFLKEEFGWSQDLANSYTCIVGGHHGKPPVEDELNNAKTFKTIELGWEAQFKGKWQSAQKELIEFVIAFSGLSQTDFEQLGQYLLPPMSESILTGLVIMADWIASNQDYFPLISLYEVDENNPLLENGEISFPLLKERINKGWKAVHLSPSWKEPPQVDIAHISTEELYRSRFVLPVGARLRPVQEEAVRIAQNVENLGLMIIEAPMGEGKTEAALATAEVMADRKGCGGVCLALPTMATTDAMFGRVHSWLQCLPVDSVESQESMFLAHGKAQLNEEFQGLLRGKRSRGFRSIGLDVDDESKKGADSSKAQDESTVVEEWMEGRKKGVLANFLVCTVDQVLMAGLDMKHLALRQLALANKVVIIDECHAYDVYMQQYLKRVLEWLGSFDVPVILLSATLPQKIRKDLIESYVQGKTVLSQTPKKNQSSPENIRKSRRKNLDDSSSHGVETCSSGSEINQDIVTQVGYPLITYTDNLDINTCDVEASGRSSTVELSFIKDDDASLVSQLEELLSAGGCAGVICDTVNRAQHAAQILKDAFSDEEVYLTHSRFIDLDRMDNENYLRSILGPQATRANGKRSERVIVVGTQVLEQSLDIDFDVLITDVAPTDLIMQRIGRLHRHSRGSCESERPQKLRHAHCYVRGIESWEKSGPVFAQGIDRVYFNSVLLEFLAVEGLISENSSAVLSLPENIAEHVRCAYGDAIIENIPQAWEQTYRDALEKSSAACKDKIDRAGRYLLSSVSEMCKGEKTLVGWFTRPIEADGKDEDRGQRAVRDTQETVEVILLVRESDNTMNVLPWVQSQKCGDDIDSSLPIGASPDNGLAKIIAQSTVRLPLSMGQGEELDVLIGELEEACGEIVSGWEKITGLSGQIVVLLTDEGNGNFGTDIHGFHLVYSREIGLNASRIDEN